jgi:hypothetical protein
MDEHTSRAQDRENVSRGLQGVREAAKRDKGLRFTTLLHHGNGKLLLDSFYQLKEKGCTGSGSCDMGWIWGRRAGTNYGPAWPDSSRSVPGAVLTASLHPETDGRQRPLGIAALEDKIVQQALARVLQHIYEEDFLGFSYSFRSRRSAKKLTELIELRIASGMADYGLELHSEKTRLIQFGRFAAEDRKRDGEGKPETFNFLGFTHICGTIWKSGKFTVHRKTAGKRMTGKLRDIAA